MGKIVVTEYLSLDGVMGSPEQWSGQFWKDQAAQFKIDELFASAALLLGRQTYQDFAGTWPQMGSENEFAVRMNSIPKYVVSNMLDRADWNNSTILRGDLADNVARTKGQHSGDILVQGSAMLVDGLRQRDLIDEYRLLIHPVIVGADKLLFTDGFDLRKLKLIENKTLDGAVVLLIYQTITQGES